MIFTTGTIITLKTLCKEKKWNHFERKEKHKTFSRPGGKERK